MNKITELFRKTLLEGSFTYDDETAKLADDLNEEINLKVFGDMRDANWKINQAIKSLHGNGVPFEIIVNNLIKQAVEVSYWNVSEESSWEGFVREIFEFQMSEPSL